METFRKIQLLINEINDDIRKAQDGCAGRSNDDIKFALYKFKAVKKITEDLVYRLS